ncbi:MAG: acylneuraminate cytidylyltransferase family protein, partial [Candidatus Omnitrophota bacterium]
MYKNKKILALIPARGGSKGLPGKNIRMLSGKPLIAWSIEQA